MTRAGWVAVGLAALAGCQREERHFRPGPPFAEGPVYERGFERNAYALSEGKRLYLAMNCNGCHNLSGGGIGPPLIDAEWIYGFEPEAVFETLTRGRPNGMPSFGGAEVASPGVNVAGTLPEYQRWQLVAYVRSLSGLADTSAAPSRSDHMKAKPPENETSPEPAHVAPPPDAGDKPK